MRQKLIVFLRDLDAVSVENPAFPGTPDINFIEGWLECKWLREWPKKDNSIVHLEHFTPQQKVWIYRRWRKKGNVYLVLQCRKEWFVFDGETAFTHVGMVTKEELIKLAVYYSNSGLTEEFKNVIRFS